MLDMQDEIERLRATPAPRLILEKAVEATENTEATEWAWVLRRIVFLRMGVSGKTAHTLFLRVWRSTAHPCEPHFLCALCGQSRF